MTALEAGVVAHALHALANHIEAHHLPTPAEFQIDDDTRRLELHLAGGDAKAWMTSLGTGITDIQTAPAARDSALQWITIHGQLPDTGVRVQLQWIRHNPEVEAARLVLLTNPHAPAREEARATITRHQVGGAS